MSLCFCCWFGFVVGIWHFFISSYTLYTQCIAFTHTCHALLFCQLFLLFCPLIKVQNAHCILLLLNAAPGSRVLRQMLHLTYGNTDFIQNILIILCWLDICLRMAGNRRIKWTIEYLLEYFINFYQVNAYRKFNSVFDIMHFVGVSVRWRDTFNLSLKLRIVAKITHLYFTEIIIKHKTYTIIFNLMPSVGLLFDVHVNCLQHIIEFIASILILRIICDSWITGDQRILASNIKWIVNLPVNITNFTSRMEKTLRIIKINKSSLLLSLDDNANGIDWNLPGVCIVEFY